MKYIVTLRRADGSKLWWKHVDVVEYSDDSPWVSVQRTSGNWDRFRPGANDSVLIEVEEA